MASTGQARSCSCSRRNTPLRLPRGAAKSEDALAVAIGLVVEPGEDLRAPVADAAANAEAARAGAEVAPVAQGRDGTTSATSCMVSSSSSACGVTGTAAHWMVLMAYLLAGCRSRFARSDECRSFSTRTVDRSWWSIARRRRHHRLRTPWGYVGLAQVRCIPRELSGPACRAVSYRNVVAPVPDKMPGTTSNKTSAIRRRVRQQAPLNLCQFRQE